MRLCRYHAHAELPEDGAAPALAPEDAPCVEVEEDDDNHDEEE